MSIRFNNVENPYISINYINGISVKKSSMMYRQIVKNVEEVMSVLQIISKDNNAKSVPQNNPVDVGIVYPDADEIRKYKALLDDGIITQEEFDAKKKQLLGL